MFYVFGIKNSELDGPSFQQMWLKQLGTYENLIGFSNRLVILAKTQYSAKLRENSLYCLGFLCKCCPQANEYFLKIYPDIYVIYQTFGLLCFPAIA